MADGQDGRGGHSRGQRGGGGRRSLGKSGATKGKAAVKPDESAPRVGCLSPAARRVTPPVPININPSLLELAKDQGDSDVQNMRDQ